MTSMLRPVLALCLVGCFSYSSAQEITSTGNLIDNANWSGATYGVDPGGCCASVSGSGALYDTSTNTIMFSYGSDTLTQTIGLQQALGGTGIQVHGYSVSFDYRLVGTSNGMVTSDELYVLTRITDSAGNSTQLDYWNLSGGVISGLNDFWATVGTTRSFSTPYLDPQSITFEMNGRDGGFWAGYYGPEVRNVSLSVNYSFDPCVSDPLYASTCPGYWQAFQERYGSVLAPPEPVVSTAVIMTDPVATGSDVMPIATPVASSGTNLGDSAAPSATATAQPTATAESSNSERSAPADLGSILNNIRGIEAELAGIAQRTVDQSISDSAQAGQESAQASITEAEATAESSQTVSDTSGSNLDSGVTALGTGITAVTGDAQFTVPGVTAGTTFDLGRALTQSRNQSLWSGNNSPGPDTVTDAQGRESVMSQASTSEMDQAPNLDTTPNMIGLGIDAVQSARDSSIRGSVPMPEVAPSTQMRDRPAPSELAGGADMAQLVQTPTGFDAYTTGILPDTQFYAARDIYAGQRTVDNVRALRQLASDRLHQEMVSQQYGGR